MAKSRCRLPIALIIVAFLLGARTGAQERPNLSGMWTSDAGQQLDITQDASQLTMTEAGATKRAYLMDGSESRHETTSINGETWTHVSRAKWVTNALVITTATTWHSRGQTWESMTIYFLEPTTAKLKVTKLDAVLQQGPYMELRTATYTKP